MNKKHSSNKGGTCFDIPCTRGPEVLDLLIALDPLAHPDSEKRYRQRAERFCENLMARRLMGEVNEQYVNAAIDRLFTAAEVIDEIRPEVLAELKFQMCALYFGKKTARDYAQDRLENGAPEDHSLN
jgi:hypothetical protein